MNNYKMTALEKRAVFSLSSIMGLRIIALFMVLPVFTLYAQQLDGATPLLVGLSLGIYGLFQALFQIPLGTFSDQFGRKPVIFAGLCIFALGSLIAGLSHSITWMIVGRALQGIGAIGSSILAMIADLTREEQRSKAMALSGMSIGLSFMLAMLIGPALSAWLNVSGIFILASLFALAAIALLYSWAPDAPVQERAQKIKLAHIGTLITTPQLANLNLGIFCLHAIFTASFIVIPISLHRFVGLESQQQWQLYIPVLISAFLLSLFCIGIAEKRKMLKPFFIAGILCLFLAQCLMHFLTPNTINYTTSLALFFAGFTLMEAFLPSLVSRTAPSQAKGSAMGIFSCAQFFGIFVGGTLGGWLFGIYSFTGVHLFCMILSLFWFAIALLMQPPQPKK